MSPVRRSARRRTAAKTSPAPGIATLSIAAVERGPARTTSKRIIGSVVENGRVNISGDRRFPPVVRGAGDRVTVWYKRDTLVEAWRGCCLKVGDGEFLVGFDAMPIGHAQKTMWVDTHADEYAWGVHVRPASGEDGTILHTRMPKQAVQPCPAKGRCLRVCVHPTRSTVAGNRSWPLEVHCCLALLSLLHQRSNEAGWVLSIPLAYGAELLDGEQGFTVLLDTAVRLLKCVPCTSWNAKAWPVRGDWSRCIRELHSPGALCDKLKMVDEHVIIWPRGALGKDAVAAAMPLAAVAGSCFACGHEKQSAPHPALPQLPLCGVCSDRHQSADWTCDAELLELRCRTCAHTGGAVHGCRKCGNSMCERCILLLEGEDVLRAARELRFDCTRCPACLSTDAPAGERNVRICCDSCRQEWHPSCHVPPVLELPGVAARWRCLHCVLNGPPRSPAWSLHFCTLCLNRHNCSARSPTLVLEPSDHEAFDHARALRILNENVAATNALMPQCARFLDGTKVAQIAQRAGDNGGICVVSVCDGKGTLLGILLGAGVRVRRYLSVEIDQNAQRVCRANYGGRHDLLGHAALRFLSDAKTLTLQALRARDCWPVDLLVGATPCNDLSGCNAMAEGTHGEHSSLLYKFDILARKLSSAGGRHNAGLPPCLLFENVIPCTITAQTEVRRLFQLPVLVSEGAVFEAARRPRWLIANTLFSAVPADTKNILLQDVLNPGARALSDKAGCIISGLLGAKHETVASARAHSQRNRGRQLVLCSSHGTEVRGLLVMELARALGQPFYEVDASSSGEAAKAGLLGRSFAVGMIRHALQTFIQACLVAQEDRSWVDSRGQYTNRSL